MATRKWLRVWKTKWSSVPFEMKVPSTGDTLKNRQELLFPNVLQVLKLLLVTPVTTASVRRANSALIRQVRPPQHDVSGALECAAAPMCAQGHTTGFRRSGDDIRTSKKNVAGSTVGCMLFFMLNIFFLIFLIFPVTSNILQILQIYVQITLQLRSLIFLKLHPKVVKNAYLRIAVFKISRPGGRGSMPPDPLEGATASPRRDRNAITNFGGLRTPRPPPPPP